jgi:hypothetical protein
MDEQLLPTPLVKLEVIKSPDNRGYLRFSKAFTVEQANKKHYKLISQYKTQDFNTAYSIAGVFGEAFYFGGLASLGATLLSNKTKIKVQDKITFTEVLYLDGMSGDYNKAEGNALIEIEGARGGQDYEFRYNLYTFQWAHSNAFVTYTTMHQSYYPSEQEQTDIVAFEYAGHVFKNVSFCDNFCITGISVDNSYYNEYEDDYSIKLNLTCNSVTFHQRDVIYYFNEKIYLNGKMLFTIPILLSYFKHKYKIYDVTNRVTEDVKNFFCKVYPDVKEIVSYNESVMIER